MFDSRAIVSNPNSDRDSVLKVVRDNPYLMHWACDVFNDDYEIMLAAVSNKHSAQALMNASPRLRANRTIAERCILNDRYKKCIPFVDPSLFSDREFILSVLSVRPYVFVHSTVPWTRDFLVDCVVVHGDIINDLSDEYTEDRQFALDVIAKGGYVLFNLSDQLKDDREVVLAQLRIECGGICLKDASHRLQRDRDMVLEAVRTNPTLLEDIRLYMEYTPDERDQFLSDVEIVTTAIAEYGSSIRYAAHTCRTDRIMVMTALTSKDPADIGYIPSSLLSDSCIRLCITENKQSTVDALLTVLETEVDTCVVSYAHKVMYKHMIGRPFTANTVLALFEFIKDGVLRSMECFTSTVSTDVRNALAIIVNECSGEHVADKIEMCLQWRIHENNGVLTDAVVEQFLDSYSPPSPNNWTAYGVCDTVADRLQRLGQISDALPYIDRAMRCVEGNITDRNKCIERVDALAARVHHPTGTYASVAHKRSYTEAFA